MKVQKVQKFEIWSTRQNRFNRKNLHVTPRTLQGVLFTNLCSLISLSERVTCSDYATDCKIWVLDPSRDM